jgi:hypothetical protein
MAAWGHRLVRPVVPAHIGPRPPGTLVGGGSSLAWWNRLTTTLGDTRGTSCTRGPTDVLSIQPKKEKGVEPHPSSVHDSTR